VISDRLRDAFNKHMNEELYSSYLYLSMAAYSESVNLPGFAHWMMRQVDEERGHAMLFYQHIVDRGGRVSLAAIAQPAADFGSPAAMFEQVLGHEREVSSMIHALYDIAQQDQDYAAQVFLQALITEQVEEEKTAEDILASLQMIGSEKSGLLMIDRELGSRA
jgi:ferritin